MVDDSNEPLPDLMYSREVALRLLRHAAWYLRWTGGHTSIFLQNTGTIASAQQRVLKMSTGDFYRIKIMGTLEHRMNVCPCACHLRGEGLDFQPCDTCKRLHVSN